MNKFNFKSSYTWRKAAFFLLSNSLSYRDVIDANPGWDITAIPQPGAVLNKPPSDGPSGLAAFPIASRVFPGYDPESDDMYPFDSKDDYIEALSKYSPSSLKNVEECNGYSATSTRVMTGLTPERRNMSIPLNT